MIIQKPSTDGIEYDPDKPVDPMAEPLDDTPDNLRRAAGETLIKVLTEYGESPNGGPVAKCLARITVNILDNPYGDEAYSVLIEDDPIIRDVNDIARLYWLSDEDIRKQADEITDGATGRAYWLQDKIERDYAIYESTQGNQPDITRMTPEEMMAVIKNRPSFEKRYSTLHEIISAGTFEPTITKAEAIQRITAKPIERTDFPLDKVNGNIWDFLEEADKNGQLAMNIGVEERGSRNELNIAYAIDFNELDKITNLKITKKLTPYDKRVHNAVAALFNAGYETMGIGQIYAAMGYQGTPGKNDKTKINNSLTKMTGAHIFIDNIEESNVYNYPHFKYDSSLLPMARITAEINGNITDAAIHVFTEPPLMTFAKERKQFTTIKVRLLSSPLSKTDANIRLEDYLIDRIAHIKNGRGQSKVLYEKLFDNVKAKTVKQKQRIKERVPIVLEHYKREGYIKEYELLDDGIRIHP